MSLEATEVRRGKYRRRLLAAAVASFALHLLLARGLAITHFGRDGDGPESTVAAKPLTPKKKSDFQLSVPRSAATARPAHEQPLELKVKPIRTAEQATAAAAQPAKNVAERRPQVEEAGVQFAMLGQQVSEDRRIDAGRRHRTSLTEWKPPTTSIHC